MLDIACGFHENTKERKGLWKYVQKHIQNMSYKEEQYVAYY